MITPFVGGSSFRFLMYPSWHTFWTDASPNPTFLKNFFVS
jgi:hypothetical protein